MPFGPYTYQTAVSWKPDVGGGEATGGAFPLAFDSPPEFGGKQGQWTPESLLVAAAESCTMLTFLSIARRKQLKVTGYQSSAEGELASSEEGIQRFVRFEVRPKVQVATEEDAQKARTILSTVHKYCFIGTSLKAEPQIVAEVTVSG